MTKIKEVTGGVEEGLRIYDEFASKFGYKIYRTPRTNTLERFAELKAKSRNKMLLREMMEEYLYNF